MPLIAKQSEGSNIEPVEAGTHQGICYSVIDLGTQRGEWKGRTNLLRKVLIGWELPEVRFEIEKDGVTESRPRVISKMYTLSLSEKSNLYNDLLSWRGKPFTAEELVGFDIFNVLGANCILQVVHKERNGKAYANITAVTGLVKGMQKKSPEVDFVKYSMVDNGLMLPEGLPKWIFELIQRSEEYQMVSRNQGNSKLKAAQEMCWGGGEEPEYDDSNADEDLPF